MVKGIWHASFTVSDLERSVKFYTEVLGMEVVHEQEQKNEYTAKLVNYKDAHLKVAMLAIPGYDHGVSGHIIELVEYVHPQGEKIDTQTCNPGTAHFAFVVDDIHEEFERMKKLGVRFKADKPVAVEAGRNKGGYTIYFLDPDDITLELFQPPKR